MRGLERLGGFGGVADRLNEYNHYLGDPGFLQRDLGRYRQVTTASVKAFAQTLTKNSRVVVHGVPGTQDLGPEVPKPTPASAAGAQKDSVNADEAWRDTTPKAGPARALRVPVPTSFRLANGLTVLLNDRQGVPIVSATLVLKSGSGSNPPGKPGLASFTAAMLTEGTTSRSAPQIADDIAQAGGSLSATSTVDSMQASVSSLTRTFPQMLTLLADVVRRPSFPPQEVERQRTSRLTQLTQQRQEANAIASAVTAAALYGGSHPYGFAELGTEASNRAITVDDLRGFWAKNFVPNNAALVVSGRISESALRPLVEQMFGDWQPGGTVSALADVAPDTTRAKVVLVDKPGASQSQLRGVVVAAARNTPDFEPMVVLNSVFGGLFSSRINLNLREEHGYTYGANSQFVFRRSPGFFTVSSGVRTDVTAPALAETVKELARIRDGVTTDELTLAKDAIIRSLPADFETSGRVSSTTANLFLYGLPLDYYARAQARFAAVTSAQVSAAAKKYLVPEKTLFIVVGDKAKVGAAIEQLNLGPLELWTPEATRDTRPPSR